jgi:hypothetical protein
LNFLAGEEKKNWRLASVNFSLSTPLYQTPKSVAMASVTQVVTLPLPALPEGWSAEKDFKAVGKLSGAVQRSIEPVGPHFLAHARRARHKRTFSEDDRIQAQESAKKVEDIDDGEESEAEDPMMLQAQAKDWKVCERIPNWVSVNANVQNHIDPGSLQGSRTVQVPLQGHRGSDQEGPPQEGS